MADGVKLSSPLHELLVMYISYSSGAAFRNDSVQMEFMNLLRQRSTLDRAIATHPCVQHNKYRVKNQSHPDSMKLVKTTLFFTLLL